MNLTIAIFGTRTFGASVARHLHDQGHTITAVIAPAARPPYHQLNDHAVAALPDARPDPLSAWAHRTGTRRIDAVTYTHSACPHVDVIVAAHSHNFIGRATRAKARLAAVGYHPSLLPLHRGRDAVRWTIRDGDRVTGGTVYHLTDNVDGGPIAAQEFTLIPPGVTAGTLWREHLAPLGVRLLGGVVGDVAAGRAMYVPQDEGLATWEPSWERAPLHRPEVPQIGAGQVTAGGQD